MPEFNISGIFREVTVPIERYRLSVTVGVTSYFELLLQMYFDPIKICFLIKKINVFGVN